MARIAVDDLLGRDRYVAARDAIRRRIIAHKRARRVAVGERLTFLFEDRATVWYQIQEMLFVEHVTDLDAIRDELAVYNALLPGVDELSATLLIGVEDRERIREELDRLHGIDRHVALVVGEGPAVAATFEGGRQTEEKLSAVQYVRVALPPEARAGLCGGAPVALRVTHPACTAHTVLPEAVRASLAADLAGPAAADAALRRVRDGD